MRNIPVNPTYHEVINNKSKVWEENKSNEYKEYRRKWKENPERFILEDAPIHLDIEPTNACNLKCPMCPRTIIMEDENRKDSFKVGNMDMETYKKIIDEAVSIGVYSIKLNWLGEPLVNKDIVNMVEYAKEKGIVDVMMNTNAALLTKDLSKSLIEAGLDKLFFSFDSPNKEKYEKIRIGAKYDDVLDNIKNFIETREELNETSPITRVSMVLMEDNKKEYEEFVKLFETIVDVVSYVEYREEILSEENINVENDFACSQLWQRMFIAWDGDVVPCCVDNNKDLLMGNIHQNTIKEIWNSDKYSKLREKHKNGEWYKSSRCRNCPLTKKNKDGSI